MWREVNFIAVSQDSGIALRHGFRFRHRTVQTQFHPWRHLALIAAFVTVTAIAAFAAAVFSLQVRPSIQAEPITRVEPITDPTNLRRLAFEDLSYEGAFRLPSAESNGDSFSFSGGPLAFNPDGPSLFVGARSRRVAEVSIPQPVNSAEIGALPMAAYVQPFADPSDGRLTDIAPSGISLSGLLVHNRQLLGAGLIYYDANNIQTLSHFARPLRLGEPSVKKLVRVWQNGKSGFVAGYMAAVPPEWQSSLGGPAITGQCCIAIITRSSWGPAAFAFDPAEVSAGRNANAEPLLYYPLDHPTLGPWEGSNPTYGGTMQLGGVALIAGTRTALFIGRNGMGPFCYGNGTGDQALAASRPTGNERYCYDPTNTDKGQHAYPYRYQMWAYDLSELAEVRAGRRDPWSVKPYGVWPFDLPTAEPGVRIGGVAYDPARQRIYVAQLLADRDGFAHRPLIHVYTVK